MNVGYNLEEAGEVHRIDNWGGRFGKERLSRNKKSHNALISTTK